VPKIVDRSEIEVVNENIGHFEEESAIGGPTRFLRASLGEREVGEIGMG
jgi:hypothetical protein